MGQSGEILWKKEGNIDKGLPGVMLLSLISLDCNRTCASAQLCLTSLRSCSQIKEGKYSEKRNAESVSCVYSRNLGLLNPAE